MSELTQSHRSQENMPVGSFVKASMNYFAGSFSRVRKTYLIMKSLSAPCDKTGFLPLVLSRFGRKLQWKKLAVKTLSTPARRSRQIPRAWMSKLKESAPVDASKGDN